MNRDDVMAMTNEELNETVLKALGWEYSPSGDSQAWQLSKRRYWSNPDYTSSDALAMELIYEMAEVGERMTMRYLPGIKSWLVWINSTNRYAVESDLRVAICRAYLLWRQE